MYEILIYICVRLSEIITYRQFGRHYSLSQDIADLIKIFTLNNSTILNLFSRKYLTK